MNAPSPTLLYLSNCKLQHLNFVDKRKLLVLDLNGSLLYRPPPRHLTKPIPRPGVKNFLKFAFANFNIVVWSSAQSHNIQKMMHAVMNKEQRKQVLLCMTREDVDFEEGDRNTKIQTYKNLTKVWQQLKKDKDDNPAAWNQFNTVIVDDSAIKCCAQPYNLLQLSDFQPSPTEKTKDFALVCAIRYLKHLKRIPNVCDYIRSYPFTSIQNVKSQEEGLRELDKMFKAYKRALREQSDRLELTSKVDTLQQNGETVQSGTVIGTTAN
ncbi:NLI interacting factor family phosphatase [Schizosaccharomyces japonicus yFS275]|uniref:Mitochondrial import inner membrane translocase subunit TIM50 n=1 Tax=Schizosaccharomyces japonicus (strain yFS275 / FY16936) TaxID=402676 RepID=B6K603_SCHJY|nr:NLI interacting factor family phosphatase [Schizosaccharomyces japonicus yFS275]EEB08957.1 NLI interacting factor family phosphatase [Schizosaccharomyces japonicus yFS275]